MGIRSGTSLPGQPSSFADRGSPGGLGAPRRHTHQPAARRNAYVWRDVADSLEWPARGVSGHSDTFAASVADWVGSAIGLTVTPTSAVKTTVILRAQSPHSQKNSARLPLVFWPGRSARSFRVTPSQRKSLPSPNRRKRSEQFGLAHLETMGVLTARTSEIAFSH